MCYAIQFAYDNNNVNTNYAIVYIVYTYKCRLQKYIAFQIIYINCPYTKIKDQLKKRESSQTLVLLEVDS